MRAQTTWVVILGTIVAIIGAVFAIIGFLAEKNTAMGVAGAVVAIVAITGTIWLYRRSAGLGKPAFDAAVTSDFTAIDKAWFHASGLAVDRQRRLLLIGTETGTTRVPLSDISNVVYHRSQNSPAFGGNSIMALILIPMAISSMIHNASKAGLNITAGGRTYRIIGIQPGAADHWESQIRTATAD